MKKLWASFLTLCLACLLFSACSQGEGIDGAETDDDGRLRVVCSVYPVYDFTQKITGDIAQVTLLVPPGVEAHDWEPSPADIVMLEKRTYWCSIGRAWNF